MIQIKHHKGGEITVHANGKKLMMPPEGQEIVITSQPQYSTRRNSIATDEIRRRSEAEQAEIVRSSHEGSGSA